MQTETLSSMTNVNVVADIEGHKIVVRVAGTGLGNSIDRKQEKLVYDLIAPLQLTPEIVLIDEHTGLLISKYIENAKTCNPANTDEVKRCMQTLRGFHNNRIVNPGIAEFNILNKINEYEELVTSNTNLITDQDYIQLKQTVNHLLNAISKQSIQKCLTHIDPNQDNFLLTPDKVYLLDWEYASMQDPMLDIAMFAIYAGYNKRMIDKLWYYYHNYPASKKQQFRYYSYIAAAGLLWYAWCIAKLEVGQSFGEYMQRQLDYAIKYSKYALHLIGDTNEN